MLRKLRSLFLALAFLLALTGAQAQTAQPAAAQKAPAAPAAKASSAAVKAPARPAPFDLSKGPGVLYVVGYAHLDTEWRWDYPTTVNEYIRNTMLDNFYLIDKYPHYVFNFSGANRYRMMQEYYPAEYQKVKKYVAAGRWFPAGSSNEENDVNSPSAESVIRQILYGKHYFRKEFGFTSNEFMLPDCFGFPASLPSILNHMGLKGFSTQKLSSGWQPAPKVGGPNSIEKTPEGIPFNVGIWEGPDGKTIVAALNPESYSGQVQYDLSKTPPPPPPADPNNPRQRRGRETDWPSRVAYNGEVTGVFADYHYYGTGDIGGSPSEGSVALMEAIVGKAKIKMPAQQAFNSRRKPYADPLPEGTGEATQMGDGPLKVISATAEQLFNDIKPSMYARLPRYKGDLELINHSAGSITSEAYMKRWNRKNELLAGAAEEASVAAAWLGGRTYPQQRLNDAWTLVTLGQFHDIIPGTSIPKAYEYAWNDQVLAQNQFAGVLTSATQAVASAMDTQVQGTAVVVYNPLNIERQDVVEAKLSAAPGSVKVIGPDGQEVPSQGSNGKVLFLARVPSAGYAVYDVQPGSAKSDSALKVTESSLENARYTVKIDRSGDISSVFDKQLNKELLSAPIRLAIKTDKPRQWPAWNMDWEDEVKAPRAFVSGPAKVRIVENGPVRVALEIERETEGSKFVQTVRLSAGDAANRVEIGHVMDWKIKESNLKVRFPFSASNENATYNWDIGTIERPTAYDRQFEVASHQWVDLTDKSGSYGVTVLTDCKNASDKSDDKTINLTLVRTPGTFGSYPDQTTQDWGHHEMIYGLAGHAGDWRKGETDWQAQRLNQPLIAFESAKHAGSLGKTFSIVKISSGRVRMLALKKDEDTNEVIIRLVELDGKAEPGVKVSFAGPIASAREVNGDEEPVGPAKVTGGALVADFGAYQPRTFAVTLAAATKKAAAPVSQPVALPYSAVVTSKDGARPVNGFDSQGRAIPSELLPSEINYAGIKFKLAGTGKPNAVVPRGQTITLPAGNYNRIYVLAAAADGGQGQGQFRGGQQGGAASRGNQEATFKVGDKTYKLDIENWTGYVGQWDNRLWREIPEPPPTAEQIAQQQQRQQQQIQRAREQLKSAQAAGNADQVAELQRMIQTMERGGQRGGGRGGFGPRMIEAYDGLVPGFVRTAPVAWFASHRHTADGLNDAYQYSYLYAYTLDVPAGAKTITLPDNVRVRILAVTVANDGPTVQAAQPLYDTLEQHAAPSFYERGVALRAASAAGSGN